MNDPYGELVRAVQTLCLVSADDGTAPEEWTLRGTLEPFVKAIVHEVVSTMNDHAQPTEET